ncbi:MAG TPA: carbohydrate-binding family 9-like protein [Bacteroidales bacterium]
MQVLDVKETDFETDYPELKDISARMDILAEKHKINIINWQQYNYRPEVSFSVQYSDKEIYIKFYITEDYFKAEMTEPNQMVCEDSCVEFFVSPEEDGIYYNLEFNGIGTCLLGSGTSRADSTPANPAIISKIRRLTTVGNKPIKEKKGKIAWTITLAIPFEVFFLHKVNTLKGKTFRANFYKCGDKLPLPHYLTWSPVATEKPDFHQPAHFGILRFV